MTTITKSIAARLAVAVVAVAMALAAFAPAAQAQTTEELQAMINDLLAQVAALQAQAGGSSAVGAGVCPYTWTRDLSQGSTGMDVMKLQQFLNADPDTRVAATGAGSAGMETEYYGPATAAAVSKMQVKYRAEILTPNALVNPTGYFGASSRAKANDLCVTPVDDEGEMDDEDGMEDEDEMDDDDMTLSGEGVLDDVNFDDEEDEIEEGEEDMPIAQLTVEADDGDIEVARITFVADYVSDNGDQDPWDVFEEFSLWVDGDKIAAFDAEDEDEYLDEDDGTFRFSNLDLMVMEDEEVDIILGASVQNNIDGVDAGTSDIEVWQFAALEMRYFDADGVAVTENRTGDLGDLTGTEIAEYLSVDIEGEGASDDLDISSSSNDPDPATIAVDEDDNEEVMVFAFELDADDSDNDIELEDLRLTVSGQANDPDSTDMDEFVRDLRLVVDGQSFDPEDWDGDNNSETVTFELDNEVVVEEGDSVNAELFVEFDVDDDFITATITAETVDVDAVGADDFTVTETVSGEEHTVVSEGVIVPQSGFDAVSADTSGENDTIGTFEIDFEVTAFEGDFYVRDFTGFDDDIDASTEGVEFAVFDSTGTATTSGITAVLTTDGDEEEDGGNNFFFIEEGETDVLTLTVTVDPEATGQFRVVLEEVWYDEDTTVGSADPRVLTPASDYRTGFLTIQGSTN